MVLSQCPPQKTNVCFRFTWNVSFRGSDLLKAMMFNEFFGTQTAIGGQVNLSDPHIYLQHLQFCLFCHSKKGKTGILEQGNKALRIQIWSNPSWDDTNNASTVTCCLPCQTKIFQATNIALRQPLQRPRDSSCRWRRTSMAQGRRKRVGVG